MKSVSITKSCCFVVVVVVPDSAQDVLLKMLKQERMRVAEIEAVYNARTGGCDKPRPHSPIIGRTSPILLENGQIIGGEQEVEHENEAARRLPPLKQSRRDVEVIMRDSVTPSSVTGDTPPGTVVMENRRAALRAGNICGERVKCIVKVNKSSELSKTRQEAFDMYRKEIGDVSVLNKHKRVLKTK